MPVDRTPGREHNDYWSNRRIAELEAEVERQAQELERLRGMVAHAMRALEAEQYGEAWAALKASTKEDDDG